MSNIDFFYNGILRFDLGFHNPNKTAALLVQIILVILFFNSCCKHYYSNSVYNNAVHAY